MVISDTSALKNSQQIHFYLLCHTLVDLNDQNLLKDEFSSNGQEEAVPETTSGVGFTLSAEQQDEDLTEPTLQPYSPELIPESSPEPSSEPSQEPSPETSPEPSPESSPEPTPESSPEPSPESVTGQSLTETTPWHHEPTQSDAESSTFYTISAELTTENTGMWEVLHLSFPTHNTMS